MQIYTNGILRNTSSVLGYLFSESGDLTIGLGYSNLAINRPMYLGFIYSIQI